MADFLTVEDPCSLLKGSSNWIDQGAINPATGGVSSFKFQVSVEAHISINSEMFFLKTIA